MLRFAFAVISILIPSIAAADEWSHTAELQPATTASVRVIEPEGYQVTVNGRTDSVPAVFAVPNADNYLVLSISSPSGGSWERKIEVKTYRQTVVKIRHVAAAAPAPAPARKAATYVGVVANTTHLCKKAGDRRDMRLEFILGADVIKVVDVGVRSRVDIELPGGEYRVRRYFRNQAAWELHGTDNKTVQADTWLYHYGCTP